MDPISWTQARGPKLVDPMLGAFTSALLAKLKTGSRSWTRSRGPEHMDPMLEALASTLLPKLKISGPLVGPISWTRCRGPELVDPMLETLVSLFSSNRFWVLLPQCNFYKCAWTFHFFKH